MSILRSKLRFLRTGLIGFCLGIALALPAAAEPPADLASGAMANFTILPEPKPGPEVSFINGDGEELSLADFRGKVLLVNLWATWCGPCRREMPDLDALQAEFGGDNFEVVAISADRQGPSVIGPFYDEVGVKNLAHYNDKTMKTHRAMRSLGLPTTIIYDAEGREVGRLIGPAHWAAPEAFRLVRYFVDAAGS